MTERTDALSFDTAFHQGKLQYTAGNIDGAERSFKNALAARPRSADALIYLGHCHYQRKDYVNAEREYQAALSEDPRSACAHVNLGLVLASRDKEKSREHFKATLTSAPEYAAGYKNYAWFCRWYGDTDERTQVESLYRRALQIDPNDAVITCDLATYLYDVEKRTQEAGELCLQALKINAQHGPAHHLLGRIELERGSADEGIQHLLTALSIDPRNEAALRNLVSAKARKNKFLGLWWHLNRRLVSRTAKQKRRVKRALVAGYFGIGMGMNLLPKSYHESGEVIAGGVIMVVVFSYFAVTIYFKIAQAIVNRAMKRAVAKAALSRRF